MTPHEIIYYIALLLCLRIGFMWGIKTDTNKLLDANRKLMKRYALYDKAMVKDKKEIASLKMKNNSLNQKLMGRKNNIS